MHIYESHTGGLFTEEEVLTYEEERCETCGDSDTYIGYANNKKAARKLLKSVTDIDGSCGYDKSYIDDFINSHFEK